MFRPLGLLSKVACPDQAKGKCDRPTCPLSHAPPAATTDRKASAPVLSTKRSAESDSPSAATPAKKRIDTSKSTPIASSSTTQKAAKNAYTAASTARKTTVTPKAENTEWSTVGLKPPTISFKDHPSSTSILISARQGGLKAFFNAFIAAYDPILQSSDPTVVACGQYMCRDHALAQESELFRKASKLTYKNSSVTILVGLKKRDKAALQLAAEQAALVAEEFKESPNLREQIMRTLGPECTETGTASQVDAKRSASVTKRKGKLDLKRLEAAGFVCPIDELERYEYMAKIPEEWEGQGSAKPDAVGEVHDCERCGKTFTVGGELNETGTERLKPSDKECRYHWGKRRYAQISGTRGRTQVWTCCDRQVGSSVLGEDSCCFGPHVFKETELLDLHRREAFITTENLLEQVQDEKVSSKPLQIVAMDCELSYSTAGLSLTRLTLVDEEGGLLLDELVRCHADIVDYNTRFSGITPQDYEEKAIMSLQDVRKAMARFINLDTVLVGHGLENDLRAMRLVHTRIVDTVMLFPHIRGFPFRNALRDLTAKYLGKLIQNGTSLGHSSLEDAAMSLELVRHKIIHDPVSPFAKPKAAQACKPVALPPAAPASTPNIFVPNRAR